MIGTCKASCPPACGVAWIVCRDVPRWTRGSPHALPRSAAQHVVSLRPVAEPHEQSRQAPQAAEERMPRRSAASTKNTARRPGAGLFQARPQLLCEEAAPLWACSDGLRRHRDFQLLCGKRSPEVASEEAHLRRAARHPGLLKDDLSGLLGAARRVAPEILLHGSLVLEQSRLGAAPLARPEQRQSAFEVFVEVALRRGAETPARSAIR